MIPAPTISPASQRGTALFSSAELTRVFNETVAPEIDPQHSVVVAGAVTQSGVQAAIVYSKPLKIGPMAGEWRVEAAVVYDWGGTHDAEAKVLIKL